MEEWKVIPKYPDYEASSFGYIRNISSKKVIKHYYNGGYAQMHLYNNKVRFAVKLHRMIAEAFIPNLENKPTVNHIDKDTTNNKPSNLEWATQQENNDHKVREKFNKKETNMRPVWKCHPISGERIQRFESAKHAANVLHCLSQNIRQACRKDKQTSHGFKWQYEEETIPDEEWKELPPQFVNGAVGYLVSSHGRLKNDNNKHFKGHKTQQGYIRVSINEKLYRMHQLVARAFHPNPENKPHVNHKDGNRCNNHVDNLEWCTRSENMQHAYETGLNTRRRHATK